MSKVEFYAVDANYLQSFEGYNSGAGQTAIQNNLNITNVQKLGVWGYKVGTNGTGLLELGQGFEKGWVALSMINDKWQMLSHVKVDSWANGWMVTNSPTVYIFYWPQLLEWGGGVLGIITFLFLLLL